MLKLSLVELFLRLVPESFILALSIYAFSNTKVQMKKLIVSGVIMTISAYSVRMLPINFGVHTILLIMIYILTAVNVNGIYMIKAIRAGLIGYITLSICDFINFFLVVNIMDIPIKKMIENINLKMLLGLPSLVLFFIIIFAFYKVSSKKVEGK